MVESKAYHLWQKQVWATALLLSLFLLNKILGSRVPFHTALFSFLSVFVDENAVCSHCSVFKWIRYENDRRSHCSSKTVLSIPSSKQCLLLAAVKKVPIASLNSIMPFYSIAFQQRNVKRFQMSLFLVFTLKTHRFQIYGFSLAFSKSSVFTADQCEGICQNG